MYVGLCMTNVHRAKLEHHVEEQVRAAMVNEMDDDLYDARLLSTLKPYLDDKAGRDGQPKAKAEAKAKAGAKRPLKEESDDGAGRKKAKVKAKEDEDDEEPPTDGEFGLVSHVVSDEGKDG